MASKRAPAPRYVITAHTPDGLTQQTRIFASSAFTLARSWVEKGYEAIVVIDPMGHARGADGYQGEVVERLRLARARG